MRHLILPLLFCLPLAAQVPEEVRRLSADYEREVNKLNLAYTQKLDRLAARYRAAGEEKTAKAIEAMIAEVDGKKAPLEDTLAPVVGTWKRDTDGALWRFAADGTATFNGTGKLTISYDAEKKRYVVVGPSTVDSFALTRNPDVLNGAFEAGDRSFKYKVARIK